MGEDLLDHWVNLIKPIFPLNAWIVSQESENNHIIQIDWKLVNDSKEQNKRSRKIRVVIKEDAINDYLDRNKSGRDLFNMILTQSLYRRFSQFIPDHDAVAARFTPVETWLFSKEILTALIDMHAP